MRFDRIGVIVLDSVGIGELPDAPAFGDAGAHTLGHICGKVPRWHCRTCGGWGLDRIARAGQLADRRRTGAAYYGKMAEDFGRAKIR